MRKGWLAEKRHYKIRDKQYPSVTTILKAVNKPALVPWATRVASEYMIEQGPALFKESHRGEKYFLQAVKNTAEEAKNHWKKVGKIAADYGTIVHQTLHDYALGRHVDRTQFEEPVKVALKAWDSLVTKERIEFTGRNELTVFDDELEVAGTFDSILSIGGELYVTDYKASKGIYDEYVLQVSKYLQMYNSVFSDNIKKAAIIRLDKITGKPELYRIPNVQESIETFNHCVPLYRYLFERG